MIFTMHAVERMALQNIKEAQIVQALRSDDIALIENATRDAIFVVKNEDFGVIFAFQDRHMVVIVTAWEENSREVTRKTPRPHL